MTPLNRTPRLIAAIASVVLTVALFSGVVSIAEPQRSALMARNATEQTLPAAEAKPAVRVADAR